MPRFYYSNSIERFIDDPVDAILICLDNGQLSQHSSLETTQREAWNEEIAIVKSVLKPYCGHGTVFFEYNIPRIGRRIDVVVLIDGIVVILEFKAFNEHYAKSDIAQVWDYALDLQNFHEESHNRYILPVLVATEADLPHNSYAQFKEKMFFPLLANTENLSEVLQRSLSQCQIDSNLSDDEWAVSRYAPTPTIIEAASALYNQHTVADISRSDAAAANLTLTGQFISSIIERSKANNEKAICFVTGVPGAGKTLVGLNIATEQFAKDDIAVYLSGNYPLVEVLTEALARDKVAREKTQGNRLTKTKAQSEVKTFIQMIHHYRDTCLEGTKIVDGKVVMDETFYAKVENKSKHYIPVDHVAIFDEAQRAWTQPQLTSFMSRKKGVRGFPYSEPEYLISCLDRHPDWAVIICLVGGGQEINTGEAGIEEWILSLNRSYPHWNIYASNKMTDREYASGEALAMLQDHPKVTFDPSLHLSVSMRSFRAENLSHFVHSVLDLNKEGASSLLASLNKYPILLTRTITTAKEWLRKNAGGSERYGIVASSAGDRLRPEDIVVRLKADVVHWFLDNEEDIRSSLFLEDVATEFDVQGLELDWVCVAWDGDFRYTPHGWQYYQFNGGTKWNNVNKTERQLYRKNAYRVLLTRARQGMILFIPKGDPEDPTRLPEYYDATYEYLKSIGIPEL